MASPDIGEQFTRLKCALVCVLISLLLMVPAKLLADSSTTITVNTSMLSGTPAQLALDFVDGGPPSNTVSIIDFSTDGTLGGATPTGGVSGALAGTVELTDSFFFNEYLTDITLGTTFSFLLDATTNGPEGGSSPDAFSLFLLDPTTGLPLFSTTDPTESDSLVTLNIDGSPEGDLFIYHALGGEVVVSTGTASPTPEPATLPLIACGLALVSMIRKLPRMTRN